jgi:hypothetical protein
VPHYHRRVLHLIRVGCERRERVENDGAEPFVDGVPGERLPRGVLSQAAGLDGEREPGVVDGLTTVPCGFPGADFCRRCPMRGPRPATIPRWRRWRGLARLAYARLAQWQAGFLDTELVTVPAAIGGVYFSAGRAKRAPFSAMRRRRGFGSIDRLASGNYRARYSGPDLGRHSAPFTFDTRGDAESWLAKERRLIQSEEWTPPGAVRDSGRPVRPFLVSTPRRGGGSVQ